MLKPLIFINIYLTFFVSINLYAYHCDDDNRIQSSALEYPLSGWLEASAFLAEYAERAQEACLQRGFVWSKAGPQCSHPVDPAILLGGPEGYLVMKNYTNINLYPEYWNSEKSLEKLKTSLEIWVQRILEQPIVGKTLFLDSPKASYSREATVLKHTTFSKDGFLIFPRWSPTEFNEAYQDYPDANRPLPGLEAFYRLRKQVGTLKDMGMPKELMSFGFAYYQVINEKNQITLGTFVPNTAGINRIIEQWNNFFTNLGYQAPIAIRFYESDVNIAEPVVSYLENLALKRLPISKFSKGASAVSLVHDYTTHVQEALLVPPDILHNLGEALQYVLHFYHTLETDEKISFLPILQYIAKSVDAYMGNTAPFKGHFYSARNIRPGFFSKNGLNFIEYEISASEYGEIDINNAFEQLDNLNQFSQLLSSVLVGDNLVGRSRYFASAINKNKALMKERSKILNLFLKWDLYREQTPLPEMRPMNSEEELREHYWLLGLIRK